MLILIHCFAYDVKLTLGHLLLQGLDVPGGVDTQWDIFSVQKRRRMGGRQYQEGGGDRDVKRLNKLISENKQLTSRSQIGILVLS